MASPITINVGGTKFITSASTLTNNSAYFDSLLSGNWADSQQEIFLDRNPEAFAKLLDYMRDNIIKVKDIDANVLTLAEFLGVERLILAVKIRWYINIGRGPVVEGDEQIAEAFDKEYGGMTKAISSGFHPYFLKRDDINCEKDMVIVNTHNVQPSFMFQPSTIQITEATKPQIRVQGREDASPILDAGRGSIVGALNWLQRNGYTTYEQQMSRTHDWGQQVTFSRRKHNAIKSNAFDIFVPSEDEQQPNPIKQFALLLEDTDEDDHLLLVPAQFSEDPNVRAAEFEFECVEIEPPRDDEGRCMLGWLERNGFITYEKTYDEIFSCCIKVLVQSYYTEDNGKQKGRLYSRNIQSTT
jgi:hypothetical protein